MPLNRNLLTGIARFVALTYRLGSGAALLLTCAPVVAQAAEPATPAALHAMLPQSIRDAGFITIATDAHHPPCESFADDNTTVVGIEPDMWNQAARELGVKTKVVSVDFAALIPGVQAGRYDTALECMSDSAEREKQVTFIDFTHSAMVGYAFADSDDAPSRSSDLCGRTGGVQIGTDFATSIRKLSQACVAGGKQPITVSEFPSEAAVVLAMYSSRVDFIMDDRGAYQHIKAHASRPIRPVDLGIPPLLVGAITRSDNTALANALLSAFEAMHRDGSYDAIMAKWDITALSLAKPGLNLVSQH